MLSANAKRVNRRVYEDFVARLGVEDLIVVQTDDAILIANRKQADDIKKLVDKLPEELL